ncbi:MAG: hypothetical protein C0469_16145, partial [Cyanobacteria bacterium DS2.3.42]|nr:hypothetical protein [Cyanobacteria bacterium DS2.3.42]
FPTFEKVTPERLKVVEKAEMALRKLGFKGFRVRFHSLNTNGQMDGAELALARLELDVLDLQKVSTNDILRNQLVDVVKGAGFSFVTLDLEGYRQGSSNVGSKPSTWASDQEYVPVELTRRG